MLKMITTIGVPIAGLYGVEPLLARHLIEMMLRALPPSSQRKLGLPSLTRPQLSLE